MLKRGKLNGLFQSVPGVCLLFACAAGQTQGADPQQDGNIKNPKECVQAELVWDTARDSDVNSLIRDYFFEYPKGIKVTNRCDKNVSAAFGVDATLEGIVEDITSPGGGITNVDFSSEEVLRCEPFTTFSGAKTNFMEFPESVRDTAETYHYERASHLASSKSPGTEDIWENLRWNIRYRGCAEWSDARMKIGTGYRHACPVGICPGETYTVTADYFFSGEVVQESGKSGETETEADIVVTEPKCHVNTGSGEIIVKDECWYKVENHPDCNVFYQWNKDARIFRFSIQDENSDNYGEFYVSDEADLTNLQINWSGQCTDGVAHGDGVLTWLFGNKWKGELVDGRRHGQWVLYDKISGYADNRLLMKGNYEHGKMDGIWYITKCLNDDGRVGISKYEYTSGEGVLDESFSDGYDCESEPMYE